MRRDFCSVDLTIHIIFSYKSHLSNLCSFPEHINDDDDIEDNHEHYGVDDAEERANT